MTRDLEKQIEHNLALIEKELVDENSPLYLGNIQRHKVLPNGTVLLDRNSKEDREWYEG